MMKIDKKTKKTILLGLNIFSYTVAFLLVSLTLYDDAKVRQNSEEFSLRVERTIIR